MGFSRQEDWSGLPCSSPGHLPDRSGTCTSCSAGRFFTAEPPGKHMLLPTCVLSRVWLCATLSTVAPQAPLCRGFSWQKCASGHILQGIFPTQGLNLRLLHWQAGSLPRVPLGAHTAAFAIADFSYALVHICAISPMSVALLLRFRPGKCSQNSPASSLSILLLVCTPVTTTPLASATQSVVQTSFLVCWQQSGWEKHRYWSKCLEPDEGRTGRPCPHFQQILQPRSRHKL